MPARLAFAFLLAFSTSAVSQTGTPVPSLAPFDTLVTNLLAKYHIPAAALAITKDGRLVYARGYGFADPDRRGPAQPDSLFRIASLSKTVTAVAIVKLIEQGKLSLDTPAFELLADLHPAPGSTIDPRLAKITIRHLLNHSAGWDRIAARLDPMFMSAYAVSALGVTAPASTENIIRLMMGRGLDFTPGTRSAYSNFGYALLGRIVERVTGTNYEQWVRANVLQPAGVSRMRIGQTLGAGQSTDEVRYSSSGLTSSVFPDTGAVPWPYGGWYLEAMDAHGGWIASPVDYAKFLNAIDGRRGTALLSPDSVRVLTAKPDLPGYTAGWYACGVQVDRWDMWSHRGALDGTATSYIRTGDGFAFVLFLNSWRGETAVYDDISNGFQAAKTQVTAWPDHDLFANYPDAEPGTFAATPVISGRDGVLNAATFDRGIVSGSWFAVFGANLAPATREWTDADIASSSLPESLDGVGVQVDGKPAYVSYISPGQINAQAPEGIGSGWHRVQVVRNGAVSEPAMAHFRSNAPGAFTYRADGRTFAVATNVEGKVLGDPAVSPVVGTCASGDTIVLWTTGLARSDAGTMVLPNVRMDGVQVSIGGQSADVSYAGVVSPGLFQINLIVPPLPAGDHELRITSSGVTSPRGVVLPIGR